MLACVLQASEQRPARNFQDVGDFLRGELASLHQLAGLLCHVGLPLDRRPEGLAVLAGHRQASPGAFDNQIALELSDGAEHVQHGLPVGPCVEPILDGAEVNASGLEIGQQLAEMGDAGGRARITSFQRAVQGRWQRTWLARAVTGRYRTA